MASHKPLSVTLLLPNSISDQDSGKCYLVASLMCFVSFMSSRMTLCVSCEFGERHGANSEGEI